MTIKLQRIIEKYLLFGAIFLSINGLIHLLNLRLESVHNWPPSAITYATLLNMIYASFVFLAAAITFVLQRDLKKYKEIILLSAVWAFWHGSLLIFLNTKFNFVKIFAGYPSLHLWFPFYNYFVYFEGILMITYSALVLIWKRQDLQ